VEDPLELPPEAAQDFTLLPLRLSLMAAMLALLGDRSITSLTFTEVCKEAGRQRQAGYKAFGRGMPDLLAFLNAKTVAWLMRSINETVEDCVRKGESAQYTVVAAIAAVVRGFKDSPFFIRLMRRDADLATAYLLSRRPGNLHSTLVRYATHCALRASPKNDDARERAEKLVWEVLQRLCQEWPRDPSDLEGWPDDESLLQDKTVVALAAEFLGETKPELGAAIAYDTNTATADESADGIGDWLSTLFGAEPAVVGASTLAS
jgi:hypothetical protein